MTPVEFQWAWGLIASRPSQHARQCFYFSEQDVYFAAAVTPPALKLPVCLDLTAFVDGELSSTDAESFRHHIASCTRCQIGLLDAMQLRTRLEDL